MNSKEALEKLSYIPIYEEDKHNIITDINSCCVYKGDLYEIYGNEVDTIEKDLEILEEYRKIEEEIGIDFITLSKILKQRFVYDNDLVKIELLGLHIKSDELYLYGFVEDTTHAVYLSLKEYGKTWVLTKEKL